MQKGPGFLSGQENKEKVARAFFRRVVRSFIYRFLFPLMTFNLVSPSQAAAQTEAVDHTRLLVKAKFPRSTEPPQCFHFPSEFHEGETLFQWLHMYWHIR